MRRSVAATVVRLMPLSLAGRAGEALLPLLLAAWFGRSAETDVYWFCWATFTFAGALFFGAFGDSALVPILIEERERAPERLASLVGALVGNTVWWGILGATAIALGTVAWLSARYSGSAFLLALSLTPLLALALVALGVRSLLCAVLNAEHVFGAAPTASLVGMTVNIALVGVLHRALGVRAIAVGALCGELIAVGLLATLLSRRGLWARPTLGRPEPLLRFVRLVASESAGGAMTRLNPVVDQWVAGMAGIVGGGTLLRYAGDLALLPTSLLQATLFPVLLARLSRDGVAGRAEAFKRTVNGTLVAVGVLMVAASLVLYFVRLPLCRLLYLHGAMDGAAVARMSALLPYYLVGLPPFGALLVLARAHVARQSTRIMLALGIFNAAINAGADLSLVRPLGLAGIALGTSLTHGVIALAFAWSLRRLLREGR
jgi:putative peptidoglycan lipid II flippase